MIEIADDFADDLRIQQRRAQSADITPVDLAHRVAGMDRHLDAVPDCLTHLFVIRQGMTGPRDNPVFPQPVNRFRRPRHFRSQRHILDLSPGRLPIRLALFHAWQNDFFPRRRVVLVGIEKRSFHVNA